MISAMQKYRYLDKFVRINNYNFGIFSRCFSDKLDNAELKTLEEVETTLFVSNKYSPVDTTKVLKEYRQDAEKTRSVIRKIQSRRKQTTEKHTRVNESNLGINYKKLKLDDPLLGKIFLAARSKKNNQIITEGWRLILEAINCGLKLHTLLFSKSSDLEPILNSIEEAEIFKVPQQNLRTWSTLTTCPGLIAIFERTNDYTVKHDVYRFPITVICDNVREPSNLGSIIRTCAALPCREVIVMKGCCDPWETKALRGGCGGQFRIGIKYGIKWHDLSETDENVPIFIAENNLKKASSYPLRSYTDVEISNVHNYVIIGGETDGISAEAYRFMMQKGGHSSCINIPLAAGIDSLNTSSALTLILFEMRRLVELSQKGKPLKEMNQCS